MTTRTRSTRTARTSTVQTTDAQAQAATIRRNIETALDTQPPTQVIKYVDGLPMNDGDMITLARLLARSAADVGLATELRSMAQRLALRALNGELLYRVDE